MAHLLRHLLGILVRHRAMRASATNEDRSIAATVPSAASALLPIPFGVRAVHFAARLNFSRAEARVVALHHVILPHEAVIDFGLEYFGGQFDGRDLVAGHIVYWDLHHAFLLPVLTPLPTF